MKFVYVETATGEELSEYELEERHDQMLDEVCEEVRIGSLTYSPSRVLKKVDPIAYSMSVGEYLGYLTENGHVEEVEK